MQLNNRIKFLIEIFGYYGALSFTGVSKKYACAEMIDREKSFYHKLVIPTNNDKVIYRFNEYTLWVFTLNDGCWYITEFHNLNSAMYISYDKLYDLITKE